LSDDRVEIDNNLLENATRSTAVGEQNWFLMGAAGASERSAIIYLSALWRRDRRHLHVRAILCGLWTGGRCSC